MPLELEDLTPIARRDQAFALIVDMQERLFPVIDYGEWVAQRIETLLRGIDLLEVPVLISEQYVQGLGHSIDRVRDVAGKDARYFEKMSFSCGDDEGLIAAIEGLAPRRQVILCGLETHICVMQSAIHLRQRGYDVFLVEDACGTRLPQSGGPAIARMRAAGVIPTTTEGILFELMERCDDPAFKPILSRVRNTP